jgi:hypothetical protein
MEPFGKIARRAGRHFMTVWGSGSASSRRTIVAGFLAAVLGVAVNVYAQQAPTPAPAPAQPGQPAQAPAAPADQPAAPAAPDPFKFTTAAGAIVWYVKPDKVTDFETAWKTIKGKLATTDKPDLKALGDSLKIYRVTTDAGAQGVMYIFMADPASNTISYSPTPFLLFGSGLFTDAEARPLFDQINGALNSFSALPLAKVE